jgi:hypothetical protein
MLCNVIGRLVVKGVTTRTSSWKGRVRSNRDNRSSSSLNGVRYDLISLDNVLQTYLAGSGSILILVHPLQRPDFARVDRDVVDPLGVGGILKYGQ